jgi:hypothetical protein
MDPMGKMFQNASSLQPLGQLKPNYKLYIFYVDRKSKMAATAIHRLTLVVVSEKKAFEHFPIGSNVNLCIVVPPILDFRSA